MQDPVSQALQAAQRSAPSASKPDLLIAGATGVLGNAVLRRLVGVQRYEHTQVLAREPVQQGMRQLSLHLVGGEILAWPTPQTCDVAVVMFEPPRMFYERERALWTPEPAQLPALAQWLQGCGTKTLAVVLPHAQGTLPQSIRHGLASMDEKALAAMAFERLIILRSAEKPALAKPQHLLERLAQWMLGIFSFMVPAQEQPVRPSKIAEIVDAALQHAPLGTTVIAPEQMWKLGQHNTLQIADALLQIWAHPRDIQQV
jgi:hypothetical protein